MDDEELRMLYPLAMRRAALRPADGWPSQPDYRSPAYESPRRGPRDEGVPADARRLFAAVLGPMGPGPWWYPRRRCWEIVQAWLEEAELP